MNPKSQNASKEAASHSGTMERKRPSDFFWRPWYAKLWWMTAGVFWMIAAIATWMLPRLATIVPDGIVNLLALALHPFTIVPVLGLPLLWTWRRSVTFPWDEGAASQIDEEEEWEDLYGGESIGFGRRLRGQDLSDPADPASPFNPANFHYRMRHGRH